jgi:cytochrome c556
MRRIHVAILALAVIGLAGVLLMRNAVPGRGEGWTGLTEPDEIIEARRVLMIQMEQLMRPIDEFTAGEPRDLLALQSAAATIESMLLAFPHLFPPTTNLYDPTVRESPTTALPALWQDFATFRELAAAGETAAATIAAADGADPLRAAGRSLRASCDSCHALFTKPYTPPTVTREDLEFDFDSVFPKK